MDAYFKKYSLSRKSGNGFFLTPIELKEYIPFEPKRIYYLSEIKSSTGQHCHYEEKEFFVMVKGKCTAVIDKGDGKGHIELNSDDAIYVPSYIWHGFKDFSEGAILMAVSSTNYDSERKDYLEDYKEYLAIRDKKIKEIYGI